MPDLLEELKKVTESETTTDTPEVKPDPKPNSDDFKEETKIVDSGEPAAIDNKENSEKPKSENGTEEPKVVDYKKSAKRWVNAINLGIKYLFRPLYKSTMLEKGDEKLMKNFYRDNKDKTENQVKKILSEDDKVYSAYLRYSEYMDEAGKLPLTDDEKEDLEDALEDYLETMKKAEMSPGMALTISVMAIMVPRLGPAFPGLSEKIMNLVDGKK